MNHLYLYFSGTGNTRHVVHTFSQLYEKNNDYLIQSIEHKDVNYDRLILEANIIIIAYPIYDSDMPFIMQDFLKTFQEAFYRKTIMTIVTQLLFSGDGAALAKRILKKQEVTLLHSIHINMPNNISDVPIFKTKTVDEAKEMVQKADAKIAQIVKKINQGKTIRMGRRCYSWTLGFFLQRMWGKAMLKRYRSKLKIDQETCIKCMKCVQMCPMNNITFEAGKMMVSNTCTLCYRCVNACPTQSISLLLKRKPTKQYIRKEFN